ncbi:hypothetical protein MPSEU_000115500 [Mayamaea pseudoterrestris]|nr:hypothetical protein MPSEU_000115500 [Mayamaea pseudoterrestris]
MGSTSWLAAIAILSAIACSALDDQYNASIAADEELFFDDAFIATPTTEIMPATDSSLYVDLQDRINPSWDDLKATLVTGKNTNGPAKGSTIAVVDANLNSGSVSLYANRDIPSNMIIHTPTSTYIGRKYFDLQTRWYQEDNKTQIFRMFPGDDNVASSRTLAPRVEAFNNVGWKRGDGWYEFSARYTFLLLRSATVFQIKHNNQFWSMQLVVSSDGKGNFNLIYKKRGDEEEDFEQKTVQTNIVDKSFDIRVIDDGTYHKVYIDNVLKVEGNMTDRLDSETNKARWGFYSPGRAMDRDMLMFVTGVRVGPYTAPKPTKAPARAPTLAPTAVFADLPATIQSCAETIRNTCNLRKFYTGNNCWSKTVDSQCPSLKAYKSDVLEAFKKLISRKCVNAIYQKCGCGSNASPCSQRLSVQVCRFPALTSDEGAALYTDLWKKLVKKCKG